MRIGILGGGQLARMLALAGLPLGLRCRCLDPSPAAVAGHAGELIVGAYDDPQALARLADGVQIVTFEFENVPATAARWLLEHVEVAPSPRALEIGQDRVREKELFGALGLGVPAWRPAATPAELHAAVAAIGAPCIVKTRRLGYDGRGQVRLQPGPGLGAAIDAAWREIGSQGTGLVVEAFVPFDRELSVLAARSRSGEVAIWPLVENQHEDGILRLSRAPAPDVPLGVQRDAEELIRAVLARLDYVGVLAIELFLCGERLLANEMAPRVHNSGHWTIEGSACSQFENHLRAVLGLPLGETAMAGGGQAAMVNLIGGLPTRSALLGIRGVRLHAYGKANRPGRKLGHATIVGRDRGEVDALAARIAALPAGDGRDWAFTG